MNNCDKYCVEICGHKITHLSSNIRDTETFISNTKNTATFISRNLQTNVSINYKNKFQIFISNIHQSSSHTVIS